MNTNDVDVIEMFFESLEDLDLRVVIERLRKGDVAAAEAAAAAYVAKERFLEGPLDWVSHSESLSIWLLEPTPDGGVRMPYHSEWYSLPPEAVEDLREPLERWFLERG